MAEVCLPNALKKIIGKEKVEMKGSSVKEVLENFVNTYSQLEGKLIGSSGDLLSYVVVFLNNEDIRMADSLQTSVREEDEVKIVFAVAGG